MRRPESLPTRLFRGVAVLAVAGLGVVGVADPAAAAALRVSQTSGLNPAGQTISVSGSGFDPNRNNRFGVYVVFGPRRADFAKNANAFGAAVWVHPGGGGGGQAPMSTSGSFSVSLSVKAKYTDGDGKSVDCATTRCYVMTMAAHGVPDRSQDTFTPISFKGRTGGGSGSGSGSGSGGSGSGESGGSGGSGSGPGSATNPHGGGAAAPGGGSGAGAGPQSVPNGFATPIAAEEFRQTASGSPAMSPWPFWLTVIGVAGAGLAARRLVRRRRA